MNKIIQVKTMNGKEGEKIFFYKNYQVFKGKLSKYIET